MGWGWESGPTLDHHSHSDPQERVGVAFLFALMLLVLVLVQLPPFSPHRGHLITNLAWIVRFKP